MFSIKYGRSSWRLTSTHVYHYMWAACTTFVWWYAFYLWAPTNQRTDSQIKGIDMLPLRHVYTFIVGVHALLRMYCNYKRTLTFQHIHTHRERWQFHFGIFLSIQPASAFFFVFSNALMAVFQSFVFFIFSHIKYSNYKIFFIKVKISYANLFCFKMIFIHEFRYNWIWYFTQPSSKFIECQKC